MAQSDPLFDWLQACAHNDQPVRLINSYRGIPIAYSTRVISAGAGSAIFGVNEYQVVCLTLDGKTHIQHAESHDVYRARVISLDVHRKEVTLTEFIKAARSLGNRLCTRVQPSQPIDAEIRIGKHLFPCQLVDISLNGVGVITLGTYVYGALAIDKGSTVQLTFTLPPTHQPVQLAGQVTSVVVAEDSNQRRIGCKTIPQNSIDLLLLDYVALRRDELMRELNMVYATMRSKQLKSVIS